MPKKDVGLNTPSRRATLSGGDASRVLPDIIEECSDEFESPSNRIEDKRSGSLRNRNFAPIQQSFISLADGNGTRDTQQQPLPRRSNGRFSGADGPGDIDEEEDDDSLGSMGRDTSAGRRLSVSVLERIQLASRSFRGKSSSSGRSPSRQTVRRSSTISSGQGGSSSFSFTSEASSGTSSGALVTVGEFTSNLSRKSEFVRQSIARHSGEVVARLTGVSIYGDDGMADDGNDEPRKSYRRYRIGDPVLTSNHNIRWTNCVNKHGYPPGSGSTAEEKQGPYDYILTTVKTVHYEEDAVFYTLTRADNGTEIRGDPDNMEPILNKAAEEAAQRAASESQSGPAFESEGAHESENPLTDNSDRRAFKVLKFILEVLLFPLFLLYHLFLAMIGVHLFRWAGVLFSFTKRQANAFLKGMSPYSFSTTITTVNVIVLCSIWYMFIDQARLAFFPASADYPLAVVNFVVWSILSLELIFEIFIRPDDYRALIKSEKAFMPTTARFISGFHLLVEAVSLALFVPEFLCLFQSGLACDERPNFSLAQATLLAITGPTRLKALAGRAFYACIRLRVFGLVRLWKNMWLKAKYIKRDRQNYHSQHNGMVASYPALTEANDEEVVTSAVWSNQLRLEQKQRNNALINASNVGTALMVTNSYRALAILVTIVGVLPMITLISINDMVNSVTTDMVGHLQAVNVLTTVENTANCEFLIGTVESWVRSWYARDHSLITSDMDNFLVDLVVRPARCLEDFEAMQVGALRFVKTPCSRLGDQNEVDLQNDSDDECIVGALDGVVRKNPRSIARSYGLREGSLVVQHSTIATAVLSSEDGSSLETSFQISACFNQTHDIESSAWASCVVQFFLLLILLGGLSVLRRDAEASVLGPLRSMLKIVARYARNPLAQAGTEISKDNGNELNESTYSDSSRASDEEDNGFGTYETEQLITAVAKITDLLRKCWGVAGADIISTNLASREGALAEVFNPTVPGKSVYALFAFAAINGFDHALKCLGGDVMILINDVASVLHDEVYRWGFGDSGQCNKNLGAAFLMVFRIGLVKEVVEKLEEATKVVFSSADSKKQFKKKNRANQAPVRPDASFMSFWGRQTTSRNTTQVIKSKSTASHQYHTVADTMELSLQSLPGISTFTDRAVLGMLKSFAGIHRDKKLLGWGRDFRLSAGVNAFEVNMIFGMDAGWAVEGAVGSEYKIDATYLSPHVNMASRMMSACKHYGVTILLSEAVQELMSDPAKKKLRNVDRVTVKGSVRIQNIFTYDARHKGADFFLFSRSDDLADLDAEQYSSSIWTTDQDLQAMRHHITDDFEAEFNAGLKAYYAGDWPAAILKLESANEIMVDAAMEEGYLHDEMDDTPYRKELYRNETADGPCSYLVNFMRSKGGVAPDDWDGWHPLLSK